MFEDERFGLLAFVAEFVRRRLNGFMEQRDDTFRRGKSDDLFRTAGFLAANLNVVVQSVTDEAPLAAGEIFHNGFARVSSVLEECDRTRLERHFRIVFDEGAVQRMIAIDAGLENGYFFRLHRSVQKGKQCALPRTE